MFNIPVCDPQLPLRAAPGPHLMAFPWEVASGESQKDPGVAAGITFAKQGYIQEENHADSCVSSREAFWTLNAVADG